MRREKIEMQKTYNAEGLHAGFSVVVDKAEVSHMETVDSSG
jgi:hypothetical protein